MTTEKQRRIAEQIDAFGGALADMGERELADKAGELAGKARTDAVVVACCGHFSAGKSTLINYLCEAALLPSSPIPTSANIVSIRSGDVSEAVLTYRDGREAHVPIAEVSKHAKDGEAVRTVELRHPIPALGADGALLDTPGVDSTDDLHRQATEAALHLADVVFYVMDYNHVLSEMNMEFSKRLAEMGKPLVLIVNQIDKHRESEVPFEAFRTGVADAFRSWGVEPAATLYTTMKMPEHPHNEAAALRALLATLATTGQPLATRGAATASLELVEEAVRAVRAKHAARREELERLAASEDAEAAERYGTLRATLAERDDVRERLVDRLRNEAGAIAENANITPASTRDAAHAFLESRQPGFKVGFLFAGSKTEEERARRLEAFRADFAEHVGAQLVWHVRDAVKKAGLSLGLDEATVDGAAESIDVGVTSEWLLSKVRAVATVSGEYTLNYAREVASDVRQAARRGAAEAAERLADALEARYAAERPALDAELAALEAQLAHRRELEALDAEERAAWERLTALLPLAVELAREAPPFPDVAALRRGSEGGEGAGAVADGANGAGREGGAAAGERATLDLSRAASSAAAGAAGAEGDLRARFGAAADTLAEASRAVAGLPGLAGAAKALADKAERLREQRFTAALFGAFSAGKSSFANALLGESALPVSPNPTTAAINTVVPPTAEWPHGVACVTMKARETMLADIRHSLQALGESLPSGDLSPDDALRAIHALQRRSDALPPGGKPHLAFLRAVADGWADAAPTLGADVRADRDLFRAYVAEERRSAFVDRIELHYESALSRQGVTLVDTPGADSINARHTGVAFNYMKNADAIFFVTYYNHAFSRADRQFLEQLGRVKDAFELDKMFFLVNAADLASDAAELEDVLEHVRTNLAAFGVRNPRLFPVSSLQALEARQAGDADAAARSGIAAFEDAFRAFAGGELAALAYRSAEGELRRTAGLLQTLRQGARAGEAERRAALERLAKAEAKARELLQGADVESVRKDVAKETGEQLYYVKQRFMYRFGEWYAASFNPSALREDRGDVKQSLGWAWRDLIGYVQTELVNEALAATLRIERFMNRRLAETVERWNGSLRAAVEAYAPETWEELSFPTPDIESVWSGEEPDAKLLSSHYRNAKSFFEGDGRKALRDALEKRWQPSIADSLDALSERLVRWMEEELVRARETALERLSQALSESIESAREALEQPSRAEEIERVSERISSLLDAFDIAASVR
ncbi:dynamin family protein [Paenibacillus sp. TRM 82003]|nr:dynamin family protein [Paenibacillus sp. TRM 82003]